MNKLPKIKFRTDLDQIGFEILSLESLTKTEIPKDHNPYQPHRINFFAVLMLEKGKVNHIIDFKKTIISQNECLIISKGQVHCFDKLNEYKGYYKVDKDSVEIFELLNKEQKLKHHNLKSNIIASLLSAFLLKLENHNQKEPFKATYNHQYDLFVSFEKHLEIHFAENRNAKFYAEKQNITYKHLNEVCKQFSNKSAKEFIDDFIILEAKRQLTSTTLSVKEIAYYCGFDEVTNFQKYFKKIATETPISFRQKFQ